MVERTGSLDERLLENTHDFLVEYGAKTWVFAELSWSLAFVFVITFFVGELLGQPLPENWINILIFVFLAWSLTHAYYLYRGFRALLRSIKRLDASGRDEEPATYVFENADWETTHKVRKDYANAIAAFLITSLTFIIWSRFWINTDIESLAAGISEQLGQEVNQGWLSRIIVALDRFTGIQIQKIAESLGNQDTILFLMFLPGVILGVVIVSNFIFLSESMEEKRFREGTPHAEFLQSELGGFVYVSYRLFLEMISGELTESTIYATKALAVLAPPTVSFFYLWWLILPY